MSRIAITSDRAPRAIGPYSQAVKAGDLVFCSGQIPIDPATGELVAGGIEEQTARVIKNLTEVLSAAGASWSDVVKTTIYLTDLADFTIVNQVYGAAVGGVLPARATVQVAALPKGAAVEIEAVAHLSR
ncbi:RidA family protein [Sorangium cellulosum]|uniref:Translation initiation inhibitor n=1 Tax=Sorangium cellulosum (strain So ce56) TaxID=448385 RepID=A9GQA6_SORC5|nr:RidA family protein [Sorangium cellulosum]CAN90413.1 putative translation initiation inhibitor [Sorangium cellulosum So ce56]